MKTKKIDNLKSLLTLLVITLVVRLLPGIPWWSCVVPVIVAGLIMKLRHWQTSFFGIGFLAGFLLWSIANLYFDIKYPGDILTSVGSLLFLPKIGVITISGIIGGLLTGLAFYTGKSIIVTPRTTNL